MNILLNTDKFQNLAPLTTLSKNGITFAEILNQHNKSLLHVNECTLEHLS